MTPYISNPNERCLFGQEKGRVTSCKTLSKFESGIIKGPIALFREIDNVFSQDIHSISVCIPIFRFKQIRYTHNLDKQTTDAIQKLALT